MTQSLAPDHRTGAALVGPIMQAGEMADLVAILNQGKVEQIGTPSEVSSRISTVLIELIQ